MDPPSLREANAARIARLVADWTDAELAETLFRLRTAGDAPAIEVADPRLRGISHTWSADLVIGDDVRGLAHVDAAKARWWPCVTTCPPSTPPAPTLCWSGVGRTDLADRLVAIAGPKVWGTPFRRLGTLALNTVPAPQSAAVGTDTSPRELTERAMTAMNLAHRVMAGGCILLLYAEGTRTRTGRLRPFLRGVHRYLPPGGRVVPQAITESDRVYPIDVPRLTPRQMTLEFGPSFPVGVDPRESLRDARDAIAGLLPPDYQPEAGTPRLV